MYITVFLKKKIYFVYGSDPFFLDKGEVEEHPFTNYVFFNPPFPYTFYKHFFQKLSLI